ncbi:uncharacterized protein LOC105835516 [Monomorium pharaonis]|uniref:uncharacterized protein LOC105835516 n=1 Tax=Monomorium pharaonis TaxID=307658 RepID=UPI00063F2E8C|nr:uncharacterized protein LOC105835516 [Monomorium pharaonis]
MKCDLYLSVFLVFLACHFHYHQRSIITSMILNITLLLQQASFQQLKRMSSNLRSRLIITKSLYNYRRNLSIQKDDKDRINDAEESLINDLAEPTNCCMSGCTNCVWIKYAERLSNMIEKSNIDLQKAIFEKVQDPNMRAFLAMELRCRKLIK